MHIPSDINILLVDDSEAQINEARSLLQELGFKNFECVSNGIEALKLISSRIGRPNQVNLILIDYQMPQMDGLQLLRALRQSSPTMNLPILCMTGKGDFNVVTEFVKAKVSQMLVKPLKKDELQLRLQDAWKKHNH